MLYRTIKPMLVDAIQISEPMDITTEGGLLHANPGDWLIRDAQGNLTRCDDINFKCSFEPLSLSTEPKLFAESKSCGC
ncbi:MAG TPA: hypothetical protein VFK06_25490 [Candidatus Angelobacter sp.]|nr:hypothetical protein [Candidatus Angelobacter sp.]